jgi:polyisoprenoid-binding protein YceI
MDHQEHWQIDPTRSSLRFVLRHVIVHEIRGHFAGWGGDLVLDRRDPSRSALRAWVDLGSIDTGSQERDDHVRSVEFLDVKHLPRAEFHSTSVLVCDDGQLVVTGELDLHATIHPIELRVEPVATSRQDPRRATYSARGRLDRQLFGLHWNQDLDIGGFVVGDEIEIFADIEIVLLGTSEGRAVGGEPPAPGLAR